MDSVCRERAECLASTSGRCLAITLGLIPCDTDEGECIEGGRPAAGED